MKPRQQQLYLIPLPSLLRRVLKPTELKSLIRDEGCELRRLGRSRNWKLKATFRQLERVISAIDKSPEPSWQWLASHLGKQRENLSFDMLLTIAAEKPEITITELMSRTDCTILEARKVIDALEFGESHKY